jgi:hypothetical protein
MLRKLLAALLIGALLLPVSSWAGTVTATKVRQQDAIGQSDTHTWAHLTSTNASGAAIDVRKYRMLEVQIKGTWNTGTLTIQGSDDGSNYLILTDTKTLADISYAADPTKFIVIWETPNWIKPVLATPGTDDVTVTLKGVN